MRKVCRVIISRGSPSLVNGAGLRCQSFRSSWVRIPSPALLKEKTKNSKSDTTDIEKALNIIKEKRIKKLRGQKIPKWIVSGKTAQYLIVNKNFCTCEHFTIRCLQNKEAICYHIYAAKMSENLPEKNMDADEILQIMFRNALEILDRK